MHISHVYFNSPFELTYQVRDRPLRDADVSSGQNRSLQEFVCCRIWDIFEDGAPAPLNYPISRKANLSGVGTRNTFFFLALFTPWGVPRQRHLCSQIATPWPLGFYWHDLAWSWGAQAAQAAQMPDIIAFIALFFNVKSIPCHFGIFWGFPIDLTRWPQKEPSSGRFAPKGGGMGFRGFRTDEEPSMWDRSLRRSAQYQQQYLPIGNEIDANPNVATSCTQCTTPTVPGVGSAKNGMKNNRPC